MSIDFERLDAAITYAVEHPAEFDMSMWFAQSTGCGTTACLAGTAVALEGGWTPIWSRTYGDLEAYEVRRGDECRNVADLAVELLGLNSDQERIFYCEGLDIIIEARNEWAAEAGVPERTWTDR
jgi:hypothetical protein